MTLFSSSVFRIRTMRDGFLVTNLASSTASEWRVGEPDRNLVFTRLLCIAKVVSATVVADECMVGPGWDCPDQVEVSRCLGVCWSPHSAHHATLYFLTYLSQKWGTGSFSRAIPHPPPLPRPFHAQLNWKIWNQIVPLVHSGHFFLPPAGALKRIGCSDAQRTSCMIALSTIIDYRDVTGLEGW